MPLSKQPGQRGTYRENCQGREQAIRYGTTEQGSARPVIVTSHSDTLCRAGRQDRGEISF